MLYLCLALAFAGLALAGALLRSRATSPAWDAMGVLGAAVSAAALGAVLFRLASAPPWPDDLPQPDREGSLTMEQVLLVDGSWVLVELKRHGLGTLDVETGKLTRLTTDSQIPEDTRIEEVIGIENGVLIQYMVTPGERRYIMVTPDGLVENARTGKPYRDFGSRTGASWDAEAQELVVIESSIDSDLGRGRVTLQRYKPDWREAGRVTGRVDLPIVSKVGWQPARWHAHEVHWVRADESEGLLSCELGEPGRCRLMDTTMETLVPGSSGTRVRVPLPSHSDWFDENGHVADPRGQPRSERIDTTRRIAFTAADGISTPMYRFDTFTREGDSTAILTRTGVLEATRVYHPEGLLRPDRGSTYAVRETSPTGERTGPAISSGKMFRPTLVQVDQTLHLVSADAQSSVRMDAASLRRRGPPGIVQRLGHAVLASPQGKNRTHGLSAILGVLATLATLALPFALLTASRKKDENHEIRATAFRRTCAAYVALVGVTLAWMLYDLFVL